MKRICFLTDHFDSFKPSCHEGEFHYYYYDQSTALSAETEIPQADYYVVDDCRSSYLDRILGSLHDRGYVICLLDDVDDTRRNILVRKGVTDVMARDERADVIPYIKALETDPSSVPGKMLVLDDVALHRKAISNIIGRFGYRLLFAEDTVSLIDHMQKSNLQFVLVNLGMDPRELNEFVRSYTTRVEMRTVPIIMYKEMSAGLYIHEIMRGLNRLTRFILSTDELYSFLVDIMFRKDIIPLLDGLNYSVDFKGSSYYAQEPLKKIYYLKEGDLFSTENILHRENIDRIEGVLSLINQSIFRVKGLRWLRRDFSRTDFTTCGAGV
ncbi:MAG TPA: hypothetical protein PK926_00195 [Spirochaetota bacterium]|nr:hypothetical protein [Spirochaetota bacterium]HPI90782.1 hypothetical protein [Spirochaetota bacterium]HPR47497.1 hypothetical protein [Spirochaetota bacterium]